MALSQADIDLLTELVMEALSVEEAARLDAAQRLEQSPSFSAADAHEVRDYLRARRDMATAALSRMALCVEPTSQ